MLHTVVVDDLDVQTHLKSTVQVEDHRLKEEDIMELILDKPLPKGMLLCLSVCPSLSSNAFYDVIGFYVSNSHHIPGLLSSSLSAENKVSPFPSYKN